MRTLTLLTICALAAPAIAQQQSESFLPEVLELPVVKEALSNFLKEYRESDEDTQRRTKEILDEYIAGNPRLPKEHGKLEGLAREISTLPIELVEVMRDVIVNGEGNAPLASPQPTNRQIVAACEKEWPGQWEMIQYCADQRIEARDALSRYDAKNAGIIAACQKEWPDQPEMVRYCADERIEAQNSLSRYPAEHAGIIARCEKEWPGQWEMIQYCTDQRIKAKEALSRY